MENDGVVPTKIAVTEHDLDLFSMAPISSHLPHQFATKKFTLTHFSGLCGACRAEIPSELIRGRFDKSLDTVVVLDALGACGSCRLLTRFSYRLHDDGSFSGQRDGKWMRWRSKPVLSISRWTGVLFRPMLGAMSRLWNAVFSGLSLLGALFIRLFASPQAAQGGRQSSRDEDGNHSI